MSWSPVHTLYRRHWVPRPLRETFAFFERPENLPRITPPGLVMRIRTPPPIQMARGLTIDYTIRVFGLRCRWRSLIREYDPPSSFRDVQALGPYRRWDHRHRFWTEDGGTVIEDLVAYELPLGPIGSLVNRIAVRRLLEAIFDFRQAQIDTLLAATGRAAIPEGRQSYNG
jgi:ligand-binding SRPBCC domain-containing protein